jgi:hypothetical protein
MSFIYQGKEGWIKQTVRNVQTFRSGLCIITLEYISRKSSVNYYDFKVGDILSEEDSMPCIDGAFIFPEPSYTDMGNGFIKCMVTAYGRVNTDGAVDINRRIGDYVSTFTSSFFSGGIASQSGASQKFFDVAVYRFAARKSEFITAPDTPELYIYELDGTKLPVGSTRTESGQSFTVKTYNLSRQTENYESTSYGEFLEVIISVSATGNFVQDTAYGPAA